MLLESICICLSSVSNVWRTRLHYTVRVSQHCEYTRLFPVRKNRYQCYTLASPPHVQRLARLHTYTCFVAAPSTTQLPHRGAACASPFARKLPLKAWMHPRCTWHMPCTLLLGTALAGCCTLSSLSVVQMRADDPVSHTDEGVRLKGLRLAGCCTLSSLSSLTNCSHLSSHLSSLTNCRHPMY